MAYEQIGQSSLTASYAEISYSYSHHLQGLEASSLTPPLVCLDRYLHSRDRISPVARFGLVIGPASQESKRQLQVNALFNMFVP